MNASPRSRLEGSGLGRYVAASCMVLALVAADSSAADAQRKASELGSVSQTVDGTTMKIEYSRPVARGRDLFGKLVRWDRAWTPGANWATTFEVDKDVEINGNLLPKGKYAIWMIPRESEDWMVIFHRKARAFHVERPKESEEQLRFTAKPEQGAHMETLMWYFPVVGPDGATLRMHWGTTQVPMQISVRPTVVAAALSATERAMYTGSYSFDADWAKDARMEVVDSAGRFIATVRGPKLDEPIVMDLVPLGDHRFRPAHAMGGQVVEMNDGGVFTFAIDDGKVSSFEMRDAEGKVEARGKRVKQGRDSGASG